MKYNSKNKPLVCMMTNSTCYKGTETMKIKGVLWHSTGANNPWLCRYVQPSDNAKDRDEMLKLIGKNSYNNDWNHIYVEAGLNAWIGKLDDGTVATVQTMPWDYRPWGCASGSKGSCNNGWIQFEIAEDSLSDSAYFNRVYKEACELTAYLCKMYDLDPKGTVTTNGVKIPVILCHYDSYKLGMGSNHGDIYHWFNKYGKDMDDVRNDVAALLKEPVTATTVNSTSINTLVEKGVINSPNYWVSVKDDIKHLNTLLNKLANACSNKVVASVGNVDEAIDRLVRCGVIDSPDYWLKNYDKVKNVDKLLVKAAKQVACNLSYKVKVTASVLNIRDGAGTNFGVTGSIRNGDVYTIVAESDGEGATKWGKMKSGAGWISLDYCEKI